MSLIILGDSGVGKTSLLQMYNGKNFQNELATIGLDSITKIYNPPDNASQVTVKIWDSSGQERFRTLTRSFYKQGEGIIVVFSLSDPQSFISVTEWLHCLKEHDDTHIVKVLIGNKCDLADRSVS